MLNSFQRLDEKPATRATWSKLVTQAPFCEPSRDVGTKEDNMGSNEPVSTANYSQ